ncbi:hypothetical protein HPULCUR_004159 [Helicostylum pulchrum]|uniref:Vacuolar protein sorting-associated protein n=1 Tax=Helicostylum pulchrum TaxID=562976 RepID=A0ABP9XWG8_9FUNG
MLESLVASILNKFLKSYVSNLNYDQLKIGMWKGEVNLRDLKLRKEALDKLNLPINVSEGYLGEVTLIIPWSNFRNEPVKVIINHVYLLAVPKEEASVTLEEEEERKQILKRRRLENAEMLQSPDAQSEQNDNGGDGYLSQIVNKVIDNVQFTMRNIHIRYEDHISDPGHPFSVGITLKELSALSTDDEWTPKFISEPTKTINKLATLKSLSIYMNTDSRTLAGMHPNEAKQVYTDLIPTSTNSPREHQYILKPVSGTGKVKLNKEFGRNKPKTDITMIFDELAFGLDDHQYRDVILVIDLFHANLKKQKYLKIHPGRGKTKEYFKFAANAVLSEIHEKHYKWSWDHFKTRRDQRLKYIECYVAEKMNKATSKQLEELKELEYDLSAEDILLYRSIAKSKLRREKVRIDKQNEKKKAENAKAGWWGWISGAKPAESGKEEANDDDSDDIHFTEEQKKEFFDIIQIDEQKLIASAIDIPKDTIKFAVSTKLKRGSFTLKQDVKKPTQLDLLSVVFEDVSVGVTQYVESMKIEAALGDLQLFDGSTKGTIYHQLIGVKKGNNRDSSLLDIQNNITEKERRKSMATIDMVKNEKQVPFFSIVYEKKPLDNKADNAFSLKMRHLEIIYSPVVIAGVMKFLKPPSSKMESVNALIAVAGDTLQEFKLQSLAGLEFALETHTTFDLKVDMDAPIIIIPESLTSQDSPVMIIDAGHIIIDSKLAEKGEINDIKKKEIQKYSKEDIKSLENLMYDKFNLSLTQTKVLIGTNTKECLWQLKGNAPRNGVDARFIERIDMNFLIEMCILPGKTEFTKFKVSGRLPLLSVNLSDSKYKILMKIVDFIVPTSDDDEITTSKERPRIQDTSYVSDKNIITERFWSPQNRDISLPDSASDSTSIASRSTSPTSLTSATPSRSIESSEVEQFKLTFQVDKVSASIHESDQSNPLKETLLCEILLESFELTVLTRPLDLTVEISLKALTVIDEMNPDSEYRDLVTSKTIQHGGSNDDVSKVGKNLVNITYVKISRDHPHFLDHYEKYDQTVDIMLSTLTVVVTRKPLLRLYNWIMNTFTAPPKPSAESGEEVFEGDVFYDEGPDTNEKDETRNLSKPKLVETKDNRMKVAIHMDSVNLILNNDGARLGTCEIRYGELFIMLEPETLEVNGRFGNFTLSDDTISEVDSNCNTSIASETHIVSIVGDELADFTYQTFDKEDSNFPGYDQTFKLKMGAIRLYVTESVKPTLNFLTEFLEMKNVYDAARSAAVETAQQYNKGTSRFHFDVVVKSPVLLFPVGENKKTDRLVAHLGEIRANNKFIDAVRKDVKNISNSVDVPVTHINCGLYDISLRSTAVTFDASGESTEHSLPIIDDLDIVFDIENPENPEDVVSFGSQIEGEISDVRMALTERQYKSLLDTWEFIQKTFLGPGEKKPEITVEENAIVPSSSTQSHTSTSSHMSTSTEVQQRKSNEEPTVALDLIIKLETVYLEVLVGEQTLSRLEFNGACLKLQNMSDESMLMEVAIQSICFADARSQSNSKFREILPANKSDGPQFQVELHSYKNKVSPVMEIQVNVDSPKIVLSLDYLFLLKDFFMGPFAVVGPTEAQKFAQAQMTKKQPEKQVQHQDQAPAAVMKYNINVVDLRIICLGNPESEASEAVIFSFDQLKVIQETCLDVHLDGIGMILCRMDNIEESTMHFVEVFSILLKMETTSTTSVHKLTSITLEVDPIILRLSYQDAMLIMSIVNKGIELMGNANTAEEPKPISDDPSEMSSVLLAPEGEHHEGNNETETSEGTVVGRGKGDQSYIVMSKESLSASFDGLQIILIEDLHELPFIDIQVNPFAIGASDWSRALHASVDFVLKANNFNFKNSHWEPILEPWNFCIRASQDSTDRSMNIALESKDLLFVNVTHAFLQSLLTVSATLSETKPLAQTAQDQVKPYLVRNFTGYDLEFWNMSDDADPDETTLYRLEQGKTMPWTFRDWKKRRETINAGKDLFGVQIKYANWESIPHVPVDKEGKLAYRLKPEFKSVNHRLVVEIRLENHVKTVTFRSGLSLENSSDKDIQFAMVNKERRLVDEPVSLKPCEIYYVPIALSYDRWIVARPSEEYRWSKEMLMWSDLMLPSHPKCIECPPAEGSTEHLISYKFQVYADFDKKNPLSKQYPTMNIHLCPPIEIENLLPFDFDLKLLDQETSERINTVIETGKTAQLHLMKSKSVLSIQLDLRSDRYKCSDAATIRTKENHNAVGEKLVVTDNKNVPTNLRMNITRSSNADSLHISIYAPYLILNKSGLPVSIRHRQAYRQANVPTETIPAYKEGERIVPTIYSYPELNHRNRSQISIDESKWSDPISFEAVGNSQDITLISKNGAFSRHAGIKIEEGVGLLSLTKLVTISPRYVLKNNMTVPFKFCEFGSTEVTNIDAGQKMPLYQTNKSHVRWLCLQLQELEGYWSSPFDIHEIGKTYVKVDKGDDTLPYLIRISINIQDSTIFITFNEDDDWPYVIVNGSSVDIHFRQESLDVDDYELKSNQKSAFKNPRLFTLHPGERLKYAWDIPVAKEKRLELHVGNRHRSINFQAIGAQVPFRFMKNRDRTVENNTLSIDIIADDSALVLYLTDFRISKSLYRPKSSGTSTLASTSGEGSLKDAFETISVQHVTNYVFELKLAGLGVSVINKDAAEIVFASVKGFDFKYTDSNMYQSLRLGVRWLQIDNQLFSTTYPILCYPTTLPKVSSELASHPTLHIALDKVKDDRHGVLYFKLFSILLQEMTFEIDEDFLYSLLDFAQFQNAPKPPESKDDMFVMTIEEPDVDKAEALYYFEEFCIQPMRLNLSFVRTEKFDDKESSDTAKKSPFGYIFNVFTMTLGNINDAPIKLNALIVENLRASSEDLTSRIILHYREQVIYQIHRVLGSIDILGNPVGLFNTLSSGFGELFYEPYQGFIMSDRPQDLGIGIAKASGFMKKSVFGITDSMSRFTGSLGKGISAATMDKKFQERRRMNMTRNKPTHAIYGVTQGVGYFGTSVASGFAGLVKRPIEGAENGGVVGFVGGVGKGLVGAFTKPVVGLFDMASNVTAGIRETTTVFETGQLTRERLPRYSGKDGIVTVYSQREALGQMWLKEMESGKYVNEVYMGHSIVGEDVTIAILTYTCLMIIRSDTLKEEYAVPLDSISSVEIGPDGVYLHLRKPTTKVLSIEESTTREWFGKIIERIISQRKEEHERQ